MTVTQDLSFLSLVANASLLVKLVMALLLLVSAMSWTYIFRKMFAIRSAQKQTEDFERIFWSGGNLNNLYEDAMSARRHRRYSAAIAVAGGTVRKSRSRLTSRATPAEASARSCL